MGIMEALKLHLFSYKIGFPLSRLTIISSMKFCYPFQNNPKELDPSYKMDLDLWDCLTDLDLWDCNNPKDLDLGNCFDGSRLFYGSRSLDCNNPKYLDLWNCFDESRLV